MGQNRRVKMTDELSNQWNELPFNTMLRIPITSAIPYYFRWKIMQLKLMLKDLQELEEKHEIPNAPVLYKLVQDEANTLMAELFKHIKEIRLKRGG